MDECRCPPDVGQIYPERVVCPCLQTTAREVFVAVNVLGAQSLCDLKRLTGAGEGCTACHKVLQQYLDEHAYAAASGPCPPICSVK